MLFNLKKDMGFLTVDANCPEDFNYRLFDKADDINRNNHCHMRNIEWDVTVLESGKPHYYATLYYNKDNADAKPYHDFYCDKSKKRMIWYDLVWEYSQEDFEESLKRKLESLTTPLNITRKVIETDGRVQYLAMVTYDENK